MHCLYCHSDDHPWFNCRKRLDGWKPPKTVKAVVTIPHGDIATVHLIPDGPFDEIDVVQDGKVIEHLTRGRPRDESPTNGKSKRAAEMREYMRAYRARKKAKNP